MSAERFSSDVAAVLSAVGWHEGRDIGAQAEEMIDRTIAAARAEGVALQAFPAIDAALREFGGLKVTEAAVGRPFNGKDFLLDPTVLVRGFAAYDHIGKVVGRRCFPLGYQTEEDAPLVMAENGEVYLLHHVRDCYVGANLDAALDTLIDLREMLPDLWDFYDLDVVEESDYRFNERVTGILLAAGWAPGRDLGSEADEMIAHAVADGRALGLALEPFPAAAAAIREFGGLGFTKEALEDRAGFDGTDTRLDPSAALARPGVFAAADRVLGRRCFPVGLDLEFDSVLLIDAQGAVYEVFGDSGRVHLVGPTMDKALSQWLQDAPLTEITASGESEG